MKNNFVLVGDYEGTLEKSYKNSMYEIIYDLSYFFKLYLPNINTQINSKKIISGIKINCIFEQNKKNFMTEAKNLKGFKVSFFKEEEENINYGNYYDFNYFKKSFFKEDSESLNLEKFFEDCVEKIIKPFVLSLKNVQERQGALSVKVRTGYEDHELFNISFLNNDKKNIEQRIKDLDSLCFEFKKFLNGEENIFSEEKGSLIFIKNYLAINSAYMKKNMEFVLEQKDDALKRLIKI